MALLSPWRFRSTLTLGVFICLLFYIYIDVNLRTPTRAVSLTEQTEVNHAIEVEHPNKDTVLLVSAFFPLKSESSSKEYELWMSNFLGKIETDIYFYTTVELKPKILQLRGDLPITIDTSFASPLAIPPLLHQKDQYALLPSKERERMARYSPELYAMWNARPYLLNTGMQRTKKITYDWGFWVDAGSFRTEHKYKHWPDERRVWEAFQEGTSLTGRNPHDVIFIPMHNTPHRTMRLWNEDMGPIAADFAEAAFFGGSPKAVDWLEKAFYAYHDRYLSMDLFVGHTEDILNAMMLLAPDRFLTVWPNDKNAPAHKALQPLHDESTLVGSCGNPYFYYQFFLADAKSRHEMRTLWDVKARWAWDWWVVRKSCAVTRVIEVREALQSVFGAGWTAPSATYLHA